MSQTKRQLSNHLKIALPLPILSHHHFGSIALEIPIKKNTITPIGTEEICRYVDDLVQISVPSTPNRIPSAKIMDRRSSSSPKTNYHLPKLIQSNRNLQNIMNT
jgi:hypothetical protein